MKIKPLTTIFTAMFLSLFACSSDSDNGGSVSSSDSNGFSSKYICQLSNNNCIRVETISDCTIAGGYVVDVCQALSNNPSSSSIGSSSSVSSSSSGVYSSSSNPTSSSSSSIPIVSDCNGLTFKSVKIGDQNWMAENLNCIISGSKCYGENDSNCATYGRLYNWATAMSLDTSCNSNSCESKIASPHQGICPSGWHIPSNEDWDKLLR